MVFNTDFVPYKGTKGSFSPPVYLTSSHLSLDWGSAVHFKGLLHCLLRRKWEETLISHPSAIASDAKP